MFILPLRSFSVKLYTHKIIRPNTTLEITKEIFASPVTPKESLMSTVEMINPVFLTIWLYLSVYWNESNRINTSANINTEKNSL